MNLTRRHVLASLAASAGAGGLGLAATAARWWDRPPGAGLQTLSEDEHAFVQALAEAWMPRGGEPELSGADAGLGDFLDASLVSMTPLNRSGMKLLLQALDDSTLPLHLSAYRHLPRKQRQRILYGWLHHDSSLVRTAVQGVAVLMAVGWTTHPEVAAILSPSMRCWYGR